MIPCDYILIYTYTKQEAKSVLMGDKARFSKCEGETAKNRKLAKYIHIMVLFTAQKLNLEKQTYMLYFSCGSRLIHKLYEKIKQHS